MALAYILHAFYPPFTRLLLDFYYCPTFKGKYPICTPLLPDFQKDVCPTFTRLLHDLCPTFTRPLLGFCTTFARHLPKFYTGILYDFYPNFIRRLLDVYPTFTRRLPQFYTAVTWPFPSFFLVELRKKNIFAQLINTSLIPQVPRHCHSEHFWK